MFMYVGVSALTRGSVFLTWVQRDRELRLPEQATRTTAEPRPNAYIPDDVGLPQPYGRLAPFKPSDAGSTMRHIRRPEPKDIEL